MNVVVLRSVCFPRSWNISLLYAKPVSKGFQSKQLAFQPSNVELLAARDTHVLKHCRTYEGLQCPQSDVMLYMSMCMQLLWWHLNKVINWSKTTITCNSNQQVTLTKLTNYKAIHLMAKWIHLKFDNLNFQISVEQFKLKVQK